MFVWWNDDSKKEEKRNWYSKRLQKFNVSLQSGRQISVVVSDVFEYFISKKYYLTYPWVYFFGAPFDLATMRDFFPNYGNPARPRSKINPVTVKWKAAWNDFWYIASSPSNLPRTITGIKGRFGAL